MSCEDEVMKIGKKLEKMISNNSADHGGADDLLNKLKDMPMTLTVLQKTRIGMTVNNFRKAASKDELVVLSKTLIKSWKKLLSNDSTPSKSDKKEKEKSSNSPEQTDSPSEMMEAKDSQGSEPGKTLMRQDSEASITNDPVRIKCRELLATSLVLDDDVKARIPNAQCPKELAAKIEDSIYLEFKNTDQKYKARIRSRVANLKDKKNPKLKEGVIMGLIPPERIANMSAEEMASDEMRQLRAKFTKESIDDHQMSRQEGTVTDLFKCGKCGKKNCTYNQLQTRSSDEPMTTFVFCMECGNRWKFC